MNPSCSRRCLEASLQAQGPEAVDHDVIHVGASEARFDRILIKVEGNGINFFDLDVRCSNGALDRIPMGLHIPLGGQSRVIILRCGDRSIRNVSFTYAALATSTASRLSSCGASGNREASRLRRILLQTQTVGQRLFQHCRRVAEMR